MHNAITSLLLGLLAAVTVTYAWRWLWIEYRASNSARPRIGAVRTGIGFVTNFFDTLGIGSFAPTTAVFKFRKLVADELIPGTLNVGHALPTIVQAFVFIAVVRVEPITLAAMIAAAAAGAWLGATIVAGLSRRTIQLVMGIALCFAATLLVFVNAELLPGGGTELALRGPRLATAVAANFALGALMTAGIGLYAPCLILVSLLGMDPIAAFPVMMGSCAFLMPVAGVKFIRGGAYDSRAALGLALGGIPAVFLAAFVVRSLPLTWLRWLVVVVVLCAAGSMLRAAFGSQQPGSPKGA